MHEEETGLGIKPKPNCTRRGAWARSKIPTLAVFLVANQHLSSKLKLRKK
jgi:hypothetical protein